MRTVLPYAIDDGDGSPRQSNTVLIMLAVADGPRRGRVPGVVGMERGEQPVPLRVAVRHVHVRLRP